VGIIPAHFFSEGNVGLVSRSGTLTYQIGNELAQRGFGNSTIVGIGGDPITGTSFIDVIERFEADDQTELIVMLRRDRRRRGGAHRRVHRAERVEAGGGLHRRLHRTARQDDGHAGAIVSGSKGNRGPPRPRRSRRRACAWCRNPTQVADIAVEILGAAGLLAAELRERHAQHAVAAVVGIAVGRLP